MKKSKLLLPVIGKNTFILRKPNPSDVWRQPVERPLQRVSQHHLRLQSHNDFRNRLASKSFRVEIVEIHWHLFFHYCAIFFFFSKKSNQTWGYNPQRASIKGFHVITHSYKATVVWATDYIPSNAVFLNSSVFSPLFIFDVPRGLWRHF